MKKKLLSLSLALCMTIGLIPTSAFAASYAGKEHTDPANIEKSTSIVCQLAANNASVSPPVPINERDFAGDKIKAGWYNFKCTYKYINIETNGDAALRYCTPTTAYYVQEQGDKLYTIKNRQGQYLSVNGELKNGAHVTTSSTPYTWYMTGFGQIDGFLMCPAENKDLAASASEGKFLDGTNLILWTTPKTKDGKGHYVMRLLPLNEDGTQRNRYSIKMSSWTYPTLSYMENNPSFEFGDDYTKPINRDQLATLLAMMTCNVTSQDQKNLPGIMPTASVPEYSDTTNRSVWYLSYWGIINDAGKNKFNPQGLVTHEQMAGFLTRTLNYYDTKLFTYPQYRPAKASATSYMAVNGGKANPSDNCTIEQAMIFCNRIETAYHRAGAAGGEVRQTGSTKSWYDDGKFTIESNLGGYLNIDGNGKGVINKKNSQVFTRTFQSEGMYTLRTADGRYLAISGLPEDKKNLTVQKDAYLWYITDSHGVGNGNVMIKPLAKDSQYTLNVSDSSKEDGAPLIVYTSKVGTSAGTANHGADTNEIFRFTRVK